MDWSVDIMHKSTEAERIARYEAAKKNLIQLTTEDEPSNWTLFGDPADGHIWSMQFADPDVTLLNEIECVVSMLNNVEQYKYKLIGNLYKCLDEVDNWTDDSKASRKAEVQKMIEIIAKED